MRQSYKTFMRAIGRKSPPPHSAIRSTRRPGDKVLTPATKPWWLPEHRETTNG